MIEQQSNDISQREPGFRLPLFLSIAFEREVES
jgi:hypothetical protein